MCGSVAAAFADAGQRRVFFSQLDAPCLMGVRGRDLAKIMCDSLAKKMKCADTADAYMGLLERIRTSTCKDTFVRLVGRGCFASSLSDPVADAVVRGLDKLTSHGIHHSELPTLLGQGKLNKCIPAVVDRICAAKTTSDVMTELRRYRGSYQHRNNLATQLLCHS